MATNPISESIDTKSALAAALGVSRQSVHNWIGADWWPVDVNPPWHPDDVLTIQDTRAERSGSDPKDDVQRRWKESQILRNEASSLRVMRESSRELDRLIDTEAVRRVLRGAMEGGAATLTRQAIVHRCGDFVAAWAAERGIELNNGDRCRLDDALWEEVGDPASDAIVAALKQVCESGWGENVTIALRDEVQRLSAKLRCETPTPPHHEADEIAKLVAALRVAGGDGISESDDELVDIDLNLAESAIRTNRRLARVIAKAVAQDDWERWLLNEVGEGKIKEHMAATMIAGERGSSHG